MSTLRVSNIEAKADVSSPTVDEKIKFTNSSGDVLFHLDGKTSGITTVGINTTGNTFTVNNTTGDISFSGSVTSSGVSTFTSDVSIADKIVHIGDTDTAIRFSDANTILLETGGAQRLKITDSLKEVKNGPLRITSTFVEFSGDISTPAAAAALYRPADNQFAISTGNVERLRITSSGNIGIGTDNPGDLLTLYGTDPSIKLQDSSGDAFSLIECDNTDEGSLRFRADPLSAGANTHIRFDTDGSERLRIDSSGNIGINSTSPKTNLDISQQTGAVALPQGTTAQRPSGTAPYIRWNTTNSALEVYNGTDWVEIITDYFPTGSVILG